MGMGKTMQTIALMLQQSAATAAWRAARTQDRPRGGSLVVAPVSAMTQWAHEVYIVYIICIYVYVYVCTYVHVSVHMYIHIHTYKLHMIHRSLHTRGRVPSKS